MTADHTQETPDAAGVDRHRQLEEEVASLTTALHSRTVIDQAIGITMQARGCNAEDAWKIITSASQHANIKVRDIAQALTASAASPVPLNTTRSTRVALMAVLGTSQLASSQHPPPTPPPGKERPPGNRPPR
ncbi:ANTAR domain-containing response regulator [Nocardiopsis ansamitocini]|nr:ANTAR domain-containing protein [Nocardiopsis ansamitocini]